MHGEAFTRGAYAKTNSKSKKKQLLERRTRLEWALLLLLLAIIIYLLLAMISSWWPFILAGSNEGRNGYLVELVYFVPVFHGAICICFTGTPHYSGPPSQVEGRLNLPARNVQVK